MNEEIATDQEIQRLSGGLLDRYYPPMPLCPEEAERRGFVARMASVFAEEGEAKGEPATDAALDAAPFPLVVRRRGPLTVPLRGLR